MDLYGNPNKIGKIGTDIQEGKCSWLVVTALQNANAEQKNILINNYGRSETEAVSSIKSLYEELNLRDAYAKYAHETYNDIVKNIEKMSERLSKHFFHQFLSILHMRNC